jgi:hypothetical protein
MPKRSRKIAPELELLGEVLGRDNDHALLAEKLALSPTGDMSLMGQLSLIARKRNTLEGEAFAVGQRLFRRKPQRFAKRLPVK